MFLLKAINGFSATIATAAKALTHCNGAVSSLLLTTSENILFADACYDEVIYCMTASVIDTLTQTSIEHNSVLINMSVLMTSVAVVIALLINSGVTQTKYLI